MYRIKTVNNVKSISSDVTKIWSYSWTCWRRRAGCRSPSEYWHCLIKSSRLFGNLRWWTQLIGWYFSPSNTGMLGCYYINSLPRDEQLKKPSQHKNVILPDPTKVIALFLSSHHNFSSQEEVLMKKNLESKNFLDGRENWKGQSVIKESEFIPFLSDLDDKINSYTLFFNIRSSFIFYTFLEFEIWGVWDRYSKPEGRNYFLVLIYFFTDIISKKMLWKFDITC